MNTPSIDQLEKAETEKWNTYHAASQIAEEKKIEWKSAYSALVVARDAARKPQEQQLELSL